MGKFGMAIELNGIDQCVEVSDSDSLDIESGLTVLCWLRCEELNTWRTVISKGSKGGGDKPGDETGASRIGLSGRA